MGAVQQLSLRDYYPAQPCHPEPVEGWRGCAVEELLPKLGQLRVRPHAAWPMWYYLVRRLTRGIE